MKKLLIIINIIALIVIILWGYFKPGWEPIVTLIIFTGPFIALFRKKESIEELKNKIKNKFNNHSLSAITKLIKGLDTRVLKRIRSLNTEKLTPDKLDEQYRNFFERFSKRKNLKIESILNLFNHIEFNPIITYEVEFSVNVEKGLKKITLQNHKESKIEINNPRLMWECSCNGNIKKNMSNCPIHRNFQDYNKAKGFSKDFSNGLVIIKYDNIEVYWQNEKDLWPPSIDTFNLISDLKSQGYDKKAIESVIDIGAGTGFLGVWLAKNNNQIKKVHFSDWLLLPLFFSYTNFHNNIKGIESQYLLV